MFSAAEAGENAGLPGPHVPGPLPEGAAYRALIGLSLELAAERDRVGRSAPGLLAGSAIAIVLFRHPSFMIFAAARGRGLFAPFAGALAALA